VTCCPGDRSHLGLFIRKLEDVLKRLGGVCIVLKGQIRRHRPLGDPGANEFRGRPQPVHV